MKPRPEPPAPPRPLRVVFALFRDDTRAGGSLRVAETLAVGLRRAGTDARIVFGYGGPGPIGCAGEVPCVYLGLGSAREFHRWHRFRMVLRRVRPHIVHYIDPSIWMHGMAIGGRFRKVLHVHGVPFKESKTLRDQLAWRFAANRADLCVAITHGVRAALIQHRLVPLERAAVVYNGIDSQRFQCLPDRLAARAHFGLPPDVKVLGMACRLVANRRCDDLVRLIARLGRGWHGLLVGDGPERENLERTARELGVAARIHFAGALDDVRPAHAAMDAYALLALYDSFGLATAEAMAAGVPVVGLAGEGEYREPQNPLVTADTALLLERPALRKGQSREVEEVSLLDQLADAISRLLSDVSRARALAGRAREHVCRRFTLDVQCQTMLRVYLNLLGPSVAVRSHAWGEPALGYDAWIMMSGRPERPDSVAPRSRA